MDIKPPKKRPAPLTPPVMSPSRPNAPAQPSGETTSPTDASTAPTQVAKDNQQDTLPKQKKRRRLWLWIIGLILGLLILGGAGAYAWYKLELRPAGTSSSQVRVTINTGDSPSSIENLLKSKNLIRNTLAFDIYTRLSGVRSELQAGSYSFSPSDSTQAIVSKIVSGKVDEFAITFLPGATVAEDKTALEDAGYSQTEVDAAFNKQYDHPLFATKPVAAGLEGYIYGDTYQFNSDATVEQILTKTFDEYYSVITNNNLVAGFQKQGLTLFQGITLASIIQREVSTPDDQRQVAQIFLKRLQINMPLGSDVTYHYAAQILGVPATPTLDSPYNTRIYPGLPPGPIATPGLSALEAVANPASGDYLYFLSGDDGKTYYATTEQEHEANIANYCKIKCATP